MAEKKRKAKKVRDPEEELHRAVTEEMIRDFREKFAQTPYGREMYERARRRLAES
ncbi:MAG: hypothetical protein WD689_08740 [Gaiellaceae bacterium]